VEKGFHLFYQLIVGKKEGPNPSRQAGARLVWRWSKRSTYRNPSHEEGKSSSISLAQGEPTKGKKKNGRFRSKWQKEDRDKPKEEEKRERREVSAYVGPGRLPSLIEGKNAIKTG